MAWPEIDGLEHHPAFAVAGIARRVAVGDAAAVRQLWQDLDPAGLAAAVSERSSDRLFALYKAAEPAAGEAPDTVLAVVGLAVPPGAAVAAPFDVHVAPAATYALVVADGPMPEALADAWTRVRDSDLPRGGGADFEMHGTALPAGTAATRATLHVAIDPAAFARPPLAARLASVARAGILRRLAFDDRGLIPAVAQQHDTGEVLMVAWMNREAVEETLATRQVTYWSRSRRALWRKGETSGHRQRMVDLKIDCDADTLLVLVDQEGPACHTGERTCFFRSAGTGVVTMAGEPADGV